MMLGMLPTLFKNVKYIPVMVVFKLASIIWCSYIKQNDNNLNIIEYNIVKMYKTTCT